MSDRLEEIKNWLKLTKTGMFGGIRPSARARTYFTWLLSELEECRAQKKELMDSVRRLLNEGTDGLRYYIPARKVHGIGD